MRLIDADELKRKVTSWLRPATDELNMVDADDVTVSVLMEIEEAPTIDPVKHGHWIITEDAFGRKFGVCSECGNKDNVTTAVLGHYCWFCGTKMDEHQQT